MLACSIYVRVVRVDSFGTAFQGVLSSCLTPLTPIGHPPKGPPIYRNSQFAAFWVEVGKVPAPDPPTGPRSGLRAAEGGRFGREVLDGLGYNDLGSPTAIFERLFPKQPLDT